ncbi:extracellular solute-binding protein family 5 [Petrotoga mobilis SJ95]|uniref:Extracellular solute-binding protein family 5 n=1 Tax=Petrotoga mobilis (strain DSM 10674 / SJ95) TaxID=403833 RepID=A9BFP8_PETMO|nr:ABC transporter substrate-binding protein [Petrotoga mobilis]ABX31218.1 extracellular solute-binding protein family 5 [Petrotoga mobilis SJ95]
MKKILLFVVISVLSVFSFASTLSMIMDVTGPFSRNFNPYFSGGSNFSARGFIYETLFYINGYTGEVVPWLATDYEWSDDYLELEVTLRENVKWSDGENFNADDVVFTFNMIKSYPALDTGGMWKKGLKEVTKVDNQHVKFVLSQVDTLIYTDIFSVYIVPEHIWLNLSDPTTYTAENPIGTGAYLLGQFTSQVYTLEKNPNYWQKEKVKVDTIRIPAFTGNDAAQLALMNKEIDWGTLFFPNIENIFIKADPENRGYWLPEGNPVLLFFNLDDERFKDENFRKAIALGIDNEQLVQIGMSNLATVSNPVLIKGGFSELINDNLKHMWYDKDAEQAKEMLNDLGYSIGRDGIFTDSNGNKLSFELIVPAGWTDWIAVSQVLSSQLKQIGIDVVVSQVDFGLYLERIRNKDFELALSWVNYGINPYFFYERWLHSRNAYSGDNRGGWISLTTDSLLEIFRKTSDEKERQLAISSLQLIVLQEIPAIPLFYNPTWFEYTTYNFEGWPNKENPYALPTITGMDKAYIMMNLEPVK